MNTISVLPVPSRLPMKVPAPVLKLIENSCALRVAPYNPNAGGLGVGVGVGGGGTPPGHKPET